MARFQPRRPHHGRPDDRGSLDAAVTRRTRRNSGPGPTVRDRGGGPRRLCGPRPAGPPRRICPVRPRPELALRFGGPDCRGTLGAGSGPEDGIRLAFRLARGPGGSGRQPARAQARLPGPARLSPSSRPSGLGRPGARRGSGGRDRPGRRLAAAGGARESRAGRAAEAQSPDQAARQTPRRPQGQAESLAPSVRPGPPPRSWPRTGFPATGPDPHGTRSGW
jgi:hypothetical protein